MPSCPTSAWCWTSAPRTRPRDGATRRPPPRPTQRPGTSCESLPDMRKPRRRQAVTGVLSYCWADLGLHRVEAQVDVDNALIDIRPRQRGPARRGPRPLRSQHRPNQTPRGNPPPAWPAQPLVDRRRAPAAHRVGSGRRPCRGVDLVKSAARGKHRPNQVDRVDSAAPGNIARIKRWPPEATAVAGPGRSSSIRRPAPPARMRLRNGRCSA